MGLLLLGVAVDCLVLDSLAALAAPQSQLQTLTPLAGRKSVVRLCRHDKHTGGTMWGSMQAVMVKTVTLSKYMMVCKTVP